MKTLSELYEHHAGKVSDKWELYLREYNSLFSPYRKRSISLLEIGIQNGGSLEIWSQFFLKAKQLVGCDINRDCSALTFSDPRISVVIGDACAEKTKNEITKKSRSFDLIIDDGSHRSSDIVQTFLMYFPLLRKGGVFVIEDLHCGYWQDYEGGLFKPDSAISFFKTLTDLVNREHWGISKTRTNLISSFEKKFNRAIDEKSLSEIHSIEFINSLCVVRKESQVNNELGKRVVVGKQDDVNQGLLASNGIKIKVRDQSLNPWTAMKNSPAEQYEELTQAVAERDGQINYLTQAVAERDGQINSLTQAVAERDGQINNLTQAVADRDGLNNNLTQAVAERDGLINNLTQAVAERDDKNYQLTLKINEMLSSTSWRLSAPIRCIGKTLNKMRTFIKKMRTFKMKAKKISTDQHPSTSTILTLPHPLVHSEQFELSVAALATSMDKDISQLNLQTSLIRRSIKGLIGSIQWLALKAITRETKAPKNEFNSVKETSRTQYDFIYTAVFGKYDTFYEPSDQVLANCRQFIIFTDRQIKCNHEKIAVIYLKPKNPKHANRFLKINSHLIFPLGSTHIYIDGNILIYSNPPFFLGEKNADMGIHPHPDRSNVLGEIIHTVRVKKLKPSELFNLFSYLRKFSLQKHQLFEANIIYRRETNTVRDINEKWWGLYKRYPYRDQFLLHGAIKHHKSNVKVIPFSLSSTRTSPYSITTKHR